MATTLPPLHTSTISSLPPADNHTSFLRKDLSSRSTSRPHFNNRYSWSSSTSPSSPAPNLSPTTSSDKAATTPRRFKLPVRVSTDLTSFASSYSSPESRRRSLSVASDSKRRPKTPTTEDKVADSKKSTSKDPSPPPPAYEKTPVSSDSSTSSKDTPPPPTAPKADEKPPPAYEKPVPPPPEKSEPRREPEPKKEAPAPRQIPTTTTTTTTQKMSSSSPEPQKGSMTANPAQGSRGLDFSMGNGNTKVTAQSGSLPLPNLSGRPNGPVGNLLRGPVDDEGNLKAAALTVGIKLDLEAEVHLSARVRGDILVGLY